MRRANSLPPEPPPLAQERRVRNSSGNWFKFRFTNIRTAISDLCVCVSKLQFAKVAQFARLGKGKSGSRFSGRQSIQEVSYGILCFPSVFRPLKGQVCFLRYPVCGVGFS